MRYVSGMALKTIPLSLDLREGFKIRIFFSPFWEKKLSF